ncbi:hypothetical protein MLD38_024364 [Melastoma candidum]|uniref:Uncharacterized protein n=1 Tax=Melastoma candidum TaxID=119954 RepID=A0ACB9NS53_9MYRT|nr:hypothetical protein MLD38_024364 [Melastoma candidum]
MSAAATAAAADARNMEGWLYQIRSNRFGLQYSRRRYFVLTDHVLKSFKYAPVDDDEVPVRSGPIDKCLRVTDNGRESIHRKVPFTFTLYNTANHHDCLKLGRSSEMDSFIASYCIEGLRLFRESNGRDSRGHTDIIQKQLYIDWFPWKMRRRDLLLRLYWRREDDGTYVILNHSVFHNKSPSQKGYTCACLKSGGYVIKPIKQGKQSQVKHMLSIDWKCWKTYLRPASARLITIHMLERVAGNFSGELSSGELVRDIGLTQTVWEDESEIPGQEVLSPVQEYQVSENESLKQPSESASLMGLHDASDEFFDVPEPVDYELEDEWSTDSQTQLISQNAGQPKKTPAAALVQRLHELVVQKKGYMDLQDAWEGSNECVYGATLHNDDGCSTPCSWTIADPSTFLIWGKTYLQDQSKIKGQSTLMQMIGADWLRSDRREDDLGGRPGGIVEKAALQGGTDFFFIVNFQVTTLTSLLTRF